jgi:hypothetical protein
MMAAITPGAHAYTYTMGQGDTCYVGDTADLSLVASWPDFQLAWCSDGEPGCGNPYVVDLGRENQHRVYIDETRFKVGNYYRWDGNWHSAEYLFAMTVLPGPRPVNETVVEIGNKTVIESEVTKPAKVFPNATHLVMARGDPVVYNYHIANDTSGGRMWIWLFHNNMESEQVMVLGDEMEYRSNDSVYSWDIPIDISRNLAVGGYVGYLQSAGANNRQDVFVRENHKVGDERFRNVMDTLYDDDIIPDLPIDGLNPLLTKSRFEQLSMSEYVDDKLIPITMAVEQPTLVFTEYETFGNNITISGTTTMAEGTRITFLVDPDHNVLPENARVNTWYADVVGGSDKVRTWNASLTVDWDEMWIGVHTIRADIDSNGIKIRTFKDFKVTDTYIMPTPTPERERVILEEYGWHRITPTIPTTIITPTPKPVETVFVAVVNGTANTTANATQNVTVAVTTAVPTQTPTPRDTNIHVPIPSWLAVLAVAGAVMWRRNG